MSFEWSESEKVERGHKLRINAFSLVLDVRSILLQQVHRKITLGIRHHGSLKFVCFVVFFQLLLKFRKMSPGMK